VPPAGFLFSFAAIVVVNMEFTAAEFLVGRGCLSHTFHGGAHPGGARGAPQIMHHSTDDCLQGCQ